MVRSRLSQFQALNFIQQINVQVKSEKQLNLFVFKWMVDKGVIRYIGTSQCINLLGMIKLSSKVQQCNIPNRGLGCLWLNITANQLCKIGELSFETDAYIHVSALLVTNKVHRGYTCVMSVPPMLFRPRSVTAMATNKCNFLQLWDWNRVAVTISTHIS